MRCLRTALFTREGGSLVAGRVTTFVVGAAGIGGDIHVVHVAMMKMIEEWSKCSAVAVWEESEVLRAAGLSWCMEETLYSWISAYSKLLLPYQS
jgi:hypothetical protein